MPNQNRPHLEVASWIAGIISALLAIYLWLKPAPTTQEGFPPPVVQASPPAPTIQNPEPLPKRPIGVVLELRALLQGLNRTVYNGVDFDYWPKGGLRNTYSHISTFITYKLLSERYARPIFLAGPHSATAMDLNSISSFGYYDPKFPQWLASQLTELLSDSSLVNSTRPMFEKYLTELGLLYFESYNYLKANPKLKAQLLAEYRQEINSTSPKPGYYYWLAWLSSNKEDSDVVWMMKQLDKRYDSNRASSAVYFWIRRSIDGTELGFFECLMKVLLAYEASTVSNFLTMKSYKYPGTQ